MTKESYRCIAIDDEPLALQVIAKFCERRGGIELQTFSDPDEGLTAVKSEKPDLVFLDIKMENITGLAIASQLPEDTCFIFTTAYLNYALDGFDLDAVDYLHKPFSYARFATAFERAERRIKFVREKMGHQTITLKQEYNNVTIPIDDILYIEAMEGYCKVYKDDGDCVVSRILLKNIIDMLPANLFLRIHRSFVVARKKVMAFNKASVTLAGGKQLPIGRHHADDVAEKLQ